MLEAPEFEPCLHHKTGHSLADKMLAVLAVVSDETSSWVSDEVLPARDSIAFLSVPRLDTKSDHWDALNKERFSVRIRACYCSAFEECGLRDTLEKRPRRVERCEPRQKVQWR